MRDGVMPERRATAMWRCDGDGENAGDMQSGNHLERDPIYCSDESTDEKLYCVGQSETVPGGFAEHPQSATSSAVRTAIRTRREGMPRPYRPASLATVGLDPHAGSAWWRPLFGLWSIASAAAARRASGRVVSSVPGTIPSSRECIVEHELVASSEAGTGCAPKDKVGVLSVLDADSAGLEHLLQEALDLSWIELTPEFLGHVLEVEESGRGGAQGVPLRADLGAHVRQGQDPLGSRKLDRRGARSTSRMNESSACGLGAGRMEAASRSR